MIFVTVGSELPFDRMLRPVDDWAASHPDIPVFAQIGTPGPDAFIPNHLDHRELLKPDEYQRYVDQADVMIAHAGMGSIITALKTGKALVIMPRLEKFRETRNDHQVGTGRRFDSYESIFFAEDERELGAKIDEAIIWAASNTCTERAKPFASEELLGHLENYIFA